MCKSLSNNTSYLNTYYSFFSVILAQIIPNIKKKNWPLHFFYQCGDNGVSIASFVATLVKTLPTAGLKVRSCKHYTSLEYFGYFLRIQKCVIDFRRRIKFNLTRFKQVFSLDRQR